MTIICFFLARGKVRCHIEAEIAVENRQGRRRYSPIACANQRRKRTAESAGVFQRSGVLVTTPHNPQTRPSKDNKKTEGVDAQKNLVEEREALDELRINPGPDLQGSGHGGEGKSGEGADRANVICGGRCCVQLRQPQTTQAARLVQRRSTKIRSAMGPMGPCYGDALLIGSEWVTVGTWRVIFGERKVSCFRPFGACSHRSDWDPRLAPWAAFFRRFAALLRSSIGHHFYLFPARRGLALTPSHSELCSSGRRPSTNVSAIWENCAYVFPATDTQVDWTASKLNELERLTCSARIARASTSVYRIRQRLGLPRGAAVVGAVGRRLCSAKVFIPGNSQDNPVSGGVAESGPSFNPINKLAVRR